MAGVKEGQGWLRRTGVRRRTDGTMREMARGGEEIHREGLVVRGDNMLFLTGRKSEPTIATPRGAPLPFARSSRETHPVRRESDEFAHSYQREDGCDDEIPRNLELQYMYVIS